MFTNNCFLRENLASISQKMIMKTHEILKNRTKNKKPEKQNWFKETFWNKNKFLDQLKQDKL